MDVAIILLGVLFAVALFVAALLDLIAAVGGTVPGDQTQLENLIMGAVLIGLLSRLTDEREQIDQDDDDDRVPLESELPPE